MCITSILNILFNFKGLKEQYDEKLWQYDPIVNDVSFISDLSFELHKTSPNESIEVNLVTHNQTISKVCTIIILMYMYTTHN